MKIHNFDGKQYIALGDFDWLCHNLVKDIYDKYEKGDEGYHLSDTDMGMVSAYIHIRVEVLADKLAEARDSATDAKSLRQNYDRVYSRMRYEWAKGKYAITATDKTQEKPETIYFSRYDDDDHPVFVGEDQRRKLLAFEEYEHAAAVLRDLTEYAEKMDEAVCDLKVVPLRHIFHSSAEQRLLNAIFGDKEPPKQRWCIMLEEDAENDRPSPMWFGEWLKHRPDQPQHILEWLESAGVKPGESAPMFCPADKGCMLFAHKGMAEKTAERIAKEYPEFDGKLHVMEYEEVDDDDDET